MTTNSGSHKNINQTLSDSSNKLQIGAIRTHMYHFNSTRDKKH